MSINRSLTEDQKYLQCLAGFEQKIFALLILRGSPFSWGRDWVVLKVLNDDFDDRLSYNHLLNNTNLDGVWPP